MDRTHRGRAVRSFGALVGGRCPMDLGSMRCAFCRCGAASRRRGPYHVPPRPGPIRQNGSLAFCWALPAGLRGLRRLASLDAGALHLGVLGTFFLAFWAKSPLGNLPHLAGTCAGLGHGRCADRHPAPCTTRFIGRGDAFLDVWHGSDADPRPGCWNASLGPGLVDKHLALVVGERNVRQKPTRRGGPPLAERWMDA